MEREEKEYRCAYCGELNETLIDPSGGSRQEYVEDCSVCCRPNVLRVSMGPENDSISVAATPES